MGLELVDGVATKTSNPYAILQWLMQKHTLRPGQVQIGVVIVVVKMAIVS